MGIKVRAPKIYWLTGCVGVLLGQVEYTVYQDSRGQYVDESHPEATAVRCSSNRDRFHMWACVMQMMGQRNSR